MQIHIDHIAAEDVLKKAFAHAANPNFRPQSKFADAIKKVILGDHKTFRYVLVTALLGKAVDNRANPLALQARAALRGAYDARSLCHKVFVPFERTHLNSSLGGSNEPFLNKPARFTHLASTNAVRRGTDQDTLNLLCILLPKISDGSKAYTALSEALYFCIKRGAANPIPSNNTNRANCNSTVLLDFALSLTKESCEGETCALVAGALLECWGEGYSKDFHVKVHPVNQSGSSSNEISDIDAFKEGRIAVTMEVKDKHFSIHDVEHAVRKVKATNFDTLLFIKGFNGKLINSSESALTASYCKAGFFLKFFTIAEFAETFLALMTTTSRGAFLDNLFKHARVARVKDGTLRHLRKTAATFGLLKN